MADSRKPGARVRWLLRGLGGFVLGAALSLGLSGPLAPQNLTRLAGNATPYDGELFSLTNQDRSSNGLGALADNGTLSAIGQSAYYGGCSRPIDGRSEDMLNNNYFSHVIPGCSADGGYVWPIMTAYGVHWSSAGENIGWNSGYSDPAANINVQFMDSPPHRANILGAYNQLGTGSWYTVGPWNYAGSGSSGYSDVYMFAEEFAEVGGYAPPPPPAPPSGGGGSGGGGSGPSAPTPAPTPTPTPTPTPKPKPPRPGIGSRPPRLGHGLLSSTIDQVISSYLDE
ncbi:MAG: CAP domain-containing protein [Candidatus Dormibacteria bacterium]